MKSQLPSTTRVAFAAVWLAGAALAQDGSNDRIAVSPLNVPVQPLTTVQNSSGGVQTLFTSIAASPTSDVPGIAGLKFQNTAGHTSPFDKPFGSANGNWIMAADSDGVSTADDLLLVNGAVAEREGNVASWATVAGSTMGPFQTRQGINASGEYVFKNNTSEASTADDYVVKASSGPVYTVAAFQTGDIPQLPNTEAWNNNLECVLITDDGSVGFEANAILNPVATTNDEIFVWGPNLLYQENITVPTGQAGGGTAAFEFLDFDDTWVSADGLNVLFKGDLTGATTSDDVVTYNGAVVLQEGFPVPGSGYAEAIASGGVGEVSMGSDGAWFARGSNTTTGDDWVVRNGVVIAKNGDPIVTASTELWDDATFTSLFFAHTGDSNGNWVIGGVTDNADVLTNGVLVYNGTDVLVREGDPIDINGNSLFDDDAFFNTFGNDKLVLFDNGDFMFVASIRNALGTAYAQGVFKLTVRSGSTVTTYCTAGTSTNGCNASMSASASTASISAGPGSFIVTASGIEGQKLGLVFYGITGQSAANWGSSSSFLCVKAPTQRLPSTNTNGTVDTCDGSLSMDFFGYMSTHPFTLGQPIAVGQVYNAQAWYRDPPSPKTTHLSNGIEFTLAP